MSEILAKILASAFVGWVRRTVGGIWIFFIQNPAARTFAITAILCLLIYTTVSQCHRANKEETGRVRELLRGDSLGVVIRAYQDKEAKAHVIADSIKQSYETKKQSIHQQVDTMSNAARTKRNRELLSELEPE